MSSLEDKSLSQGFRIRHLKYEPHILTYLAILNWSIWGVLARKGLAALTTYDGSLNYDALWANFAACFVIALVSKLPKNHFKVGLTTGFCGSLSSFSAVMLSLFYYATNSNVGVLYNYPNPGYGVMAFLSVLFIELAVSVLGFIFGKHLTFTYQISNRAYSRLSYLCGGVGIAAYIATIVLIGVKPSWRSWTFSLLFAPFGATLRYHLSKFNTKTFPWGTFTINVMGTALIAVFTLLSRARADRSSDSHLVTSFTACQVLNGLVDGFCGSLTTVSTLINEFFDLQPVKAYKYGITTFTVSFIVILLILGPYHWSTGLIYTACR